MVEQLAGPDAESAGSKEDAPHARVSRRKLDISHMVSRHAHSFRKLLLSQTALTPKLCDPLTKGLKRVFTSHL